MDAEHTAARWSRRGYQALWTYLSFGFGALFITEPPQAGMDDLSLVTFEGVWSPADRACIEAAALQIQQTAFGVDEYSHLAWTYLGEKPWICARDRGHVLASWKRKPGQVLMAATALELADRMRLLAFGSL